MPIDFQMRHLNHNTLVSVWVETTGLDPRRCDIAEICIVPLDNFMDPSNIVCPFYNQLMIMRPENVDFANASISKEKLRECAMMGVEPSMAADRLEEWMGLLSMPDNKRLVPIAYNWPLVREFLHTWLRYETFNSIFSHEYRDVMGAVLFINDTDAQHGKMLQHPRPEHFSYIAANCGLKIRMSEDVMLKARKVAEVYKRLTGVPSRAIQ